MLGDTIRRGSGGGSGVSGAKGGTSLKEEATTPFNEVTRPSVEKWASDCARRSEETLSHFVGV